MNDIDISFTAPNELLHAYIQELSRQNTTAQHKQHVVVSCYEIRGAARSTHSNPKAP